jgi:arsenate reductase
MGRETEGKAMEATRTVLFLCPHNAAKSLLAAAHFDRLAGEHGLSLRAASAGTEPADRPSPAVVAALREEGVDLAGYQPRAVDRGDLVAARLVVTMGCDVGDLVPLGAKVERWDDVPPVSQDLLVADAVIRRRVAALVSELARENG